MNPGNPNFWDKDQWEENAHMWQNRAMAAEAQLEKQTLTYRKLVMPEDLNPAHRLFGGRLLQWLDEAAALYVMCQLRTQSIVTVKVSEIVFKEPVSSGDFLEFFASIARTGRSSVDIEIDVQRKAVEKPEDRKTVLTCNMTFVQIDPATQKPTPHRLAKV